MLAKLRIDELRGTYQWLPEDPGVLGLSSWSFVEDLLAPSVALHYANLNYSVPWDVENGQDKDDEGREE